MVSADKIWNIIQNKDVIPGTWRNKRSFMSTYSDEPIFIVINEVSWYAVRIIVFDKPQRWGKGNLQVFKVSQHLTLNGAEKKADELESKLKNIRRYQGENSSLPVLGFLKKEKLNGSIEDIIDQGTWSHEISINASDAHKYLRPFDIIRIARGLYCHWAIYLGGEYVCHFTGTSVSGSSSSNSDGLNIKKDSLRTFFNGASSSGTVEIIRPVIDFKDKYIINLNVIKSLTKKNLIGSYNINSNNCEHFAKLIVLGLRHSGQGNDYEGFTGRWPINLCEEIRAASDYVGIDLDNSSQTQNMKNEITRLTSVGDKEAYGVWEARVEVNQAFLDDRCILQ